MPMKMHESRPNANMPFAVFRFNQIVIRSTSSSVIFFAGAIIELRRAGAFVRGHGLRVFQGAAGFEIGRDSRGPEGMAADPDARAEIGGAALDHAPGVDAVHRFVGQRAGATGGATGGAGCGLFGMTMLCAGGGGTTITAG